MGAVFRRAGLRWSASAEQPHVAPSHRLVQHVVELGVGELDVIRQPDTAGEGTGGREETPPGRGLPSDPGHPCHGDAVARDLDTLPGFDVASSSDRSVFACPTLRSTTSTLITLAKAGQALAVALVSECLRTPAARTGITPASPSATIPPPACVPPRVHGWPARPPPAWHALAVRSSRSPAPGFLSTGQPSSGADFRWR